MTHENSSNFPSKDLKENKLVIRITPPPPPLITLISNFGNPTTHLNITLYNNFYCHYLGLEWRLLTAGENKFRYDPFKPVKQQDVDFLRNILNQMHNNFINKVKERRPTLDVKHKTVFTGDVFLGADAVSMGLADGICSDMKALCRERFGEDVKFERCEPPKGLLSGLKNFGSETRVEVSMNDALEELAVKQQGF